MASPRRPLSGRHARIRDPRVVPALSPSRAQRGRARSNMIRLWLERRLPPEFVDLLPEGVRIIAAASDTPQMPLAMIGDAHAIVASSRVQYNAALMDSATDLRVISRTGMGVDNIDLAAASARGIAVCNAPDGPTISTAEHALALLLAVAKQLTRSGNQLRDAARIDFFN